MKNGRRLPKKFVEDQNFKWGMRLQEREREREREREIGERGILREREGGRHFKLHCSIIKEKKKMRAPN